MVKTYILFTEHDENLKKTIVSLTKNCFNHIYLVNGIIRTEKKSKIVMDSWKKFFETNTEFDDDIMLCEDDVICKINRLDMLKKIDRSKINYIFYQKILKEKSKMIPVGAQGIFIPKEKINEFISILNNNNSIHFDRWLGRLVDIYYPCGPKEWGVEIIHKSKIWDGLYIKQNMGRTL